MENIEETINGSDEIIKKRRKSREKNYTERIKRNKEKIAKLEKIIVESKKEIDKIEHVSYKHLTLTTNE